ncbi:MAG: DUF4194 domain-containing protein [Bacilli bacterium]|jgi:hypothetical protein|nr:DUF4194 domain-containing protein [Bacilli bacterium]
MFEEDFEKLTRGEQAQFHKVVSDLLYRCYIVRRMYDRATKMNKISADYLFIEKHFDLISDYLSFAGMEVSKDDDNGVVFLTSEDETNRIRIDGVTTLILYALRSFYEEKLKDNPSVNEIYCDSTSLKVLLKDLGLTTVTRRISALSLASSLRTLSMYQIVVPAKGSFGENSYAFFILPSIRYVISNAKLNALYSAIKEINEGEDDEEGLFNGDAEKEDEGEKEEESSPAETEGTEDNIPEEGNEVPSEAEDVNQGDAK